MSTVRLCVLGWLLVEVATAYPNLFFSKEGACDQPLQPLHPHHKHLAPVRDTQIHFVLNNAGDQSATEVSMWEPETMYNLTIVGPVPMLTLVSTSAGVLGDENDEGVKCEGKAWVTSSDRATSHSVLWKSPKCCEIAQDIVQIMTTIAGCSTDHFRQNEATLQGACVNQCGVDSGAAEDPVRLSMPGSKFEAEVCPAGSVGEAGEEGDHDEGHEGASHEGETHSHGSGDPHLHPAGHAPHSYGEGTDEGDEGDEGATVPGADEGDEGDEGAAEIAEDTDEGDEGDEGATVPGADEGDEGDEGAAEIAEDIDEGDEGDEGATVPGADEGDEGDEGVAAGSEDLTDNGVSFSEDSGEETEDLHFSSDATGTATTTVSTTEDPAASAEVDAQGTEDPAVAAAEDGDGSDSDQKKAARSFGVFVLAAIFAAIVAGIATVVIRRRRMRRQYQDFGTLEMRGYNQWGNEAGL